LVFSFGDVHILYSQLFILSSVLLVVAVVVCSFYISTFNTINSEGYITGLSNGFI